MLRHTLLSLPVLAILLNATLLSGCGNKNDHSDAADSTSVGSAKDEPQESQPAMTRTDTLNIAGTTYYLSLQRKPAHDLPRVSDENGQEYYDNAVQVALRSVGGDTLYAHHFTRADFADFMQGSEGCVFDGMACYREKLSPGHLVLTAQMSQPYTGEGQAFIVDVAIASRNFSVVRDDEQDTNGDAVHEAI